MGTTTFLTMNSLDPSWADRVELAVLLAPVAHVEHMESPIKVGAGLPANRETQPSINSNQR